MSWALPGARLKKIVVTHSSYDIPSRVSLPNRFGEILLIGAGHGIFRSCQAGCFLFTLLPVLPISPIVGLAFQADAIAGSVGLGYSLYLQRLCRVRSFGSRAGVPGLQWYRANARIFGGWPNSVKAWRKGWVFEEFCGRTDGPFHCLG